jgi:hypothetical protein
MNMMQGILTSETGVMSKAKKIAAMLFVVPGLISIQGCTDEEVLATVGVIAIVGGAVALGAATSGDNDNHHHHNSNHYQQNNYYYQQNNHYNPPYGHRPPYYGYGGYGHRPWAQVGSETSVRTEKLTPLASLKTADEFNAVSLVAQRYQIPMGSAAFLQKSLKETVEQKDLKPLYDLGISRDDLARMGQGQMISNTGLRNLSQKLDISEESARKVIRQMMEDARASVQSPSSNL